MAADRCPDNFTIHLIAELDCYLKITKADGSPGGDEKEFIISPGNEADLVFSFSYYIGIGADQNHDDAGWHRTVDNLNSGNAMQMSMNFGTINPPSPEWDGTPEEIKMGTFHMLCAAVGNITYDDPDTSDLEGANNQNIGGTIILNTGVDEPDIPTGRKGRSGS